MKKYTIRLGLMSKARPRFNSKTGNVYHDPKYKKWLTKVTALLKKKGAKPLGYFYCLVFDIHLKNHRTIDADNIIGALIETTVTAGMIPDDSVKHLKRFWTDAKIDSREYLSMYVCRSIWEYLEVLGNLSSEPSITEFAILNKVNKAIKHDSRT